MKPRRIYGTESVIHRLSPISKLIAVFLFWGTAMISFNPPLLATMIAFALLIWVFARMPLRDLRPLLAVSFSIGLMFTIFNALVFFNAKTILFHLPVLGWPVYREGLIFGGGIGLKIMAVVVATPILTQTTPMPSFMAGLAKMKVPYKLAFTLGTAFRLVPLVTQTFKDITESQKMRGHDVKRMKLRDKVMKGYFPLFVPLVLTLLRRSQDLDIAVESRAFGAPTKRTFLVDIGLKPRDWVFLTLFLVAFSAALYIILLGGGETIGSLVHFQ